MKSLSRTTAAKDMHLRGVGVIFNCVNLLYLKRPGVIAAKLIY